MPTVEQFRSRLIEKLKELFQLDQPDLDFGFYRIMHAKAGQVTNFLENDLFQIIKDAFGHVDKKKRAELQKAYEDTIQQAKDFGAPVPENTPAAQKAKAALDALADNVNAEGETYDHLYRFFERYYDGGDFVSLRYYTRETSGKAAPYAIPYNGEEVKLHWANADQYYIKTAEYFSNFTFDLRQAEEVEKSRGELFQSQRALEKPLRVHFRIVEASEGEHGNLKASDQTKRFFIIHKEDPVGFDEQGELICRFEYRPDPEKGSTQEGTWREHRNNEAAQTILSTLADSENAAEYLDLLNIPAPTNKQKERPLLAKYINQYTARNTWDYFIHKDLSAFLNRELDFYIKNEVMRLDDIENADAPAVETYLAKIKVLRKIAHKIIDFLAQLENFQKKLWLKKKFVVEANYCVTLDRMPEELYPQIAQNEAQTDEWIKLFAIDEIEPNLHNPGYCKPLSVDFLKANPYLVLDTRFFNEKFKETLLTSIDNFDEQCDGLLIHSENFQALNLLQERYKEQVKCIYIDPPYNTGNDDNFSYKDSYKSSSWLAMFQDRLAKSTSLMNAHGLLACHMDEHEHMSLEWLVKQYFGEDGDMGKLIWDKRNPKGDAKGIAAQHEYLHFATNNPIHLKDANDAFVRNKENAEAILNKTRQLIDRAGGVTEEVRAAFKEWINKQDFTGGEKAYSLIDDEGNVYRLVSMAWPNKKKAPDEYFIPLKHPVTGNDCPVPVRGWRNPHETMKTLLANNLIIFGEDDSTIPNRKYLLKDNLTENVASLYYMGSSDDALFTDMGVAFENPKPVKAAKYFLSIIGRPSSSTILDYFAGSGTTGHAVINLNREDGGNRKYILVEMGDYFDTVLKPRIQKVVYAEKWKNGKPVARNRGISHCFKYLRLESYEDTLNNLLFEENPAREKMLSANTSLREDYTLRYMLEVETRGSQSLLNIDAFADPTAYQLKVKKPGSDEHMICNIDLPETFNYLIGLRVTHLAVPQTFSAQFKREPDPELPQDQNTRLVVNGKIKQDESGPWWFRKIEGWLPADPNNPNNGQKEKVLIVWRKLTGDLEKDNLMLDEFFTKNRSLTRDFEFETIYTNGSNNLPNLKLEGDNWKARLIEEDFMRLMWEAGE